jgi:hypothetical protein
VRGKFPLGIEAPAFALEINSAQIHGSNSLHFIRRQLARDPREGTRTRKTRGNLLGRNAQNFGEQPRHHVRIGNLRWDGEGGVHGDAHGQRVEIAVKDLRAPCAHFHDRSLLMLRA